MFQHVPTQVHTAVRAQHQLGPGPHVWQYTRVHLVPTPRGGRFNPQFRCPWPSWTAPSCPKFSLSASFSTLWTSLWTSHSFRHGFSKCTYQQETQDISAPPWKRLLVYTAPQASASTKPTHTLGQSTVGLKISAMKGPLWGFILFYHWIWAVNHLSHTHTAKALSSRMFLNIQEKSPADD